MSHTKVSSLFPRNARTLALHMAMEAAQRAEVGQRIRELRGPLPQPELARRLNVSLRAVQKWEAGESAPQWENLVRMSKLFGVTQDFILYGERSQESTETTQLDRIEQKLDRILSRLPAEGLAEVLEQEAARVRAQREQNAAKSKRTQPRRKAS